MKLEAGMYVRTKGGFIDKIISFKSTISNDYVELEDECYANKKDILKASNNIIDILEKGDYVNGHRVDKVVIDTKCSYVLLEEVGCYVDSQEDIADYEIKSIVTSQQFESLEYKVD